MPRLRPPLALAAALLAGAGGARAGEEGPAPIPPAPTSVRVSADTYLRLFERSPMPGPNGAVVSDTFAAPLYQYASLQVENVDLPWEPASLDAELSAWGDVNLAPEEGIQRADGDITVASIRHRYGWAFAQLGRQIQAGGAARMSRLDGVSLGFNAPFGLAATAYGGWTVLPRWNERPGYHLLGSAADTVLRYPDAIPEPRRDGTWMAGGRLSYSYLPYVNVGASFHEQRENGALARRNIGLDVRAVPDPMVAITLKSLIDGDEWSFTDARLAVDVYPVKDLSLAAELTHIEPSLFLSRESVLSVFSLDMFHELGGSASYRAFGIWRIGASGYADFFMGSELGARLNLNSSVDLAQWLPVLLRGEYGWVAEPDNGYHSARLSVVYKPIEPVALTAESYLYFYNSAINGAPLSAVGALSAEWTIAQGWAVMGSGSVARTPYATLDVQALARLRINFDWEPER
jgi:hypothetical protein